MSPLLKTGLSLPFRCNHQSPAADARRSGVLVRAVAAGVVELVDGEVEQHRNDGQHPLQQQRDDLPQGSPPAT